MYRRRQEIYRKIAGTYGKLVRDVEPVDSISYLNLLMCSIGMFIGLMMIASSQGTSWGGFVFTLAAINPLRRIKNSILAYPDQTLSILFRVLFISAFFFGLVYILNSWAWGTDHSGTLVSTSVGGFSRSARTAAGSDVLLLRLIMSMLTLGAAIMYSFLLQRPYNIPRRLIR